jgi:hypothetical protein
MEKPKRASSIINRINPQRRREFDFVAPLSLSECRKRLQAKTYAPLKIDEKGELHFHQIQDAGKNLGIELDAYLAPLDEYQTHVYGNVRLASDTAAVLAFFTVTHGGVVALLLGVGVPLVVFLPSAGVAVFWFVCLHARNKLMTDLMGALDVKIKGKQKNRPDAKAE